MKTSSRMVFTLMQSFDAHYLSLDVAALVEGKIIPLGSQNRHATVFSQAVRGRKHAVLAEINLLFVRLALPHELIRRADVLPIVGKSLRDDVVLQLRIALLELVAQVLGEEKVRGRRLLRLDPRCEVPGPFGPAHRTRHSGG